jgi:hypothetical protein
VVITSEMEKEFSYPYNVDNFFNGQLTISFPRGAMLLRLSLLIGTDDCVGIIIHPRNSFRSSILSKLILNHTKNGKVPQRKEQPCTLRTSFVVSYGTVDKELPALYSNQLGNIRQTNSVWRVPLLFFLEVKFISNFQKIIYCKIHTRFLRTKSTGLQSILIFEEI